jgi:protein-S-isoprenylcysteine O-methyltransferase Ste14
MKMSPAEAIYVPWTAWLVSWLVAGLWSGHTVNRPSILAQLPYRVPETAGFFFLLFYTVRRDGRGGYHPAGGTWFIDPLWALPVDLQWAMVGLAAFGFLFCWWARIHLGRLWSSTVTRKEKHHVVKSGPYAIVRHPIYTGILIAAIATVAVRATPATIAGTALLIGGFMLKGRLEERFLRAELGTEAYDAYARKTAMLVPFLKF